MTGKRLASTKAWTYPDDAPGLAAAWFRAADLSEGGTIARRDRPPRSNPKQAVNIRFDAEMPADFRVAGPGWQSRGTAALRKAAG
jgi:uncharacterized protein (DUF4415 family)